ncbi:hypothetical protein HZI65_02875 [Haemophilus haemolyticus]|uniref:Uncharacterized protein n=1 Tax=Haemophilus haemolyticus TaxID=726 RepID=A0A502JTE6_HAEHA|nr:hypothetical protein [Haemophilus haemolyticus]NYA24996.1 hypothetical protein [Haemophilus haemolyticus]TPH00779.1 hypothetical protein EUX55_02910 [Haemophilus haemolyticus]
MQQTIEIIEKIAIPLITFVLGFISDHYLKYHQNKKARLDSIETKFRSIIGTVEKEKYSKSLLVFDYNIVRIDIVTYCRDYKISISLINSDLIDLTLFTTSDNINPLQVSDIFSKIMRTLRLHKK